jgi:hypothetical protein
LVLQADPGKKRTWVENERARSTHLPRHVLTLHSSGWKPKLLISSFVFQFAFLLHPSLAWHPYPETYAHWQSTRPFLVMGLHNSVPSNRLPERIDRFKAAGLNNLSWKTPLDALHMFQAANSGSLQWSCGANGGTNAIAQALAIAGNSFVQAGDEPVSAVEVLDAATVAAWVRANHPERPVLVNLSIYEYDHGDVISQVQPDMISIAQYPLLRDGTTQSNYLYHVDWARQSAVEHSLPLWMFLQARGQDDANPADALRIPDAADLRFLVYTFLAHGGTGILLFDYYGHAESPIADTGPPHSYEDLVPSSAWFALRDLGNEIQNIGRALVPLRTRSEVMYVGNGLLWNTPAPVYPLHNPNPPIGNEAFTPHGALLDVQIAETNEMGAMVSFFEDEHGEEYFMIVNLQHGADVNKSDGMRKVRLVFDGAVAEVERVNRWTGNVETLSTTNDNGGTRSMHVFLEGGTGDLFKWATGEPWAFIPPVAPDIAFVEEFRVEDTTMFSVQTATGECYALEYSISGPTGTWNRAGVTVLGTGLPEQLYDPAGHSTGRTYRVVTLP